MRPDRGVAPKTGKQPRWETPSCDALIPHLRAAGARPAHGRHRNKALGGLGRDAPHRQAAVALQARCGEGQRCGGLAKTRLVWSEGKHVSTAGCGAHATQMLSSKQTCRATCLTLAAQHPPTALWVTR